MHIDAQEAVNAVLDTLTHHVDRGAFAALHQALPQPLRAYLALPARGAPTPTKEATLTAEA